MRDSIGNRWTLLSITNSNQPKHNDRTQRREMMTVSYLDYERGVECITPTCYIANVVRPVWKAGGVLTE